MATAPVDIDADEYRPTEQEPFMNDRQLAYFREKLMKWKEDLLRGARDTLGTMRQDNMRESDLADRAASVTEWSVELRARDRQRKLISKIDSALRRIDEGEYGYCEVTGDAIALARLEARPIATMTVDAQESHERRERVFREA